MSKKEVKTDYWVHGLLREAGIELEPQGSSILEIDIALKTASKAGSGNVGYPEFVGVVKDFLLVIEDKADLSKHVKLDSNGVISMDPKDVQSFAVNGALFYGKHLAKNTAYKKVITFGVSGNEKRHRISPIYIDETEYYRELPDVESFISFNIRNIDEYYIREILKESTDQEKDLAEILKDAAVLHKDLRNYGSLKDADKPLVVSGILLALRESEFKNFSISDLTGDIVNTDGQKIFRAIESNLKRSNVSPEVKRDKILSQFSIIKDTYLLNEKHSDLQKTPLRHFVEFLHEKIYKTITYTRSSEDYIGRFYGEFMSYSGGDGQTLGIILTPKHITDLFCDLVSLKYSDTVLDPCAGTGGFLIAAMHHMLMQTAPGDKTRQKEIRQKQLHGFESQPYMFAIATTNMILRGDGKSNLINCDFLKEEPGKTQTKGSTVGMMNPPYSQGSKKAPGLYEIAFVEHLLDSLVIGGRSAVIIPQSSVAGKTKEEEIIKKNMLKNHTLEGVVTLNKDTFDAGVIPCIAVFTAGEPHPKEKKCKFIDFQEDGYRISPHIGLIETEQAKDRKQHLLDMWFDRIEAESKFFVRTSIEEDDEWLHSFFYFDDTIPSDADFEKTVENYLSFEFAMIVQNRRYLFDSSKKPSENIETETLEDKEWKEFFLKNIFQIIQRGKRLTRISQNPGSKPYVSSTALNNGVDNFISNDTGVRSFSNCLTIANSGSVGASFFHPYEFVASDHVTCLKNDIMNCHIYLFIGTLTNRLSAKYNFNREINDKRISRERIMLPVDSDGNPDYQYMEQYIKNLEYKKRKQYLDFQEQT